MCPPADSSTTKEDEFVAFLEAELDCASDPQEEEAEVEEDAINKYSTDFVRFKRSKIEVLDSTRNLPRSTSHVEEVEGSDASLEEDECRHPGFINNLCIRCGQKMDDESGIAFAYIHKNLRLASDEIARLRHKDLKNLLQHKKLYLVLDLDHTLLNSSRLLMTEEGYLVGPPDDLPDALKSSLYRLDSIQMMTKLRPFVHSFLKEASKLFEMYIYTLGKREYALQMANLLDPRDVYFNSRVIAQEDSLQRLRKSLDIFLGQESAVLILDDREVVWRRKDKENLILMERYNFFASSCPHYDFNSLSQLRSDESEVDGALATVLGVLQRIHCTFFNPKNGESLINRDVRQTLKTIRMEVLKGCKVVLPANMAEMWKMAVQLGATLSTELDPLVTHVVSVDAGNENSRWAVEEKKFLVNPRWIEAAYYLWRKQPEETFPVNQAKN